jgi:hypothetical protein
MTAEQFNFSPGRFVPLIETRTGTALLGGELVARFASAIGCENSRTPEPRTIRDMEKTNAKTRRFSSFIVLL